MGKIVASKSADFIPATSARFQAPFQSALQLRPVGRGGARGVAAPYACPPRLHTSSYSTSHIQPLRPAAPATSAPNSYPCGAASPQGFPSDSNGGNAVPPSIQQYFEVSPENIPDGCSTDLSAWGLPEQVVSAYQKIGIFHMFPWQAACLAINDGRVLDGGNLVFSAPTSAGKTLVAEILLLKRVVESRKKGLFVLPFVALAQEKLASLQRLLKGTGVRVGGFIGNSTPPAGLLLIDIAVCTIERANSLVNRLIKESKLHEVGVIVVDELHIVGDYSRGYLLELLLTKITYLSGRKVENDEQVESDTDRTVDIQIVAMSATLPNLPIVKKWLKADLYITDFRPVPLYESIKLGPFLYDKKWTRIREVPVIHGINDPDHVCALCVETIQNGHSVLIFCPTRLWCENVCNNLTNLLATFMPPAAAQADQLRELVEQLRKTPAGLDGVLKRTIPMAVAFHHAGLTADERDIVEGGFRRGSIKILVSTTTLSAGVNLPARRVLIRSPTVYDGGNKPLDPLTYYQMAGRAGRKGIDTQGAKGESILICKDTQEEKRAVNSILSTAPHPLKSCLSIGSCEEPSAAVVRAVLEIVVNKAARSVEDIITYLEGALFSCELDDEESCKAYAMGVIKCLVGSQLIQTETSGSGVKATQLGCAVIWSGLSPDDGKTVFEELTVARPNVNLQNELHILYLVTPLNVVRSIGDLNFYQFLYVWDKMPVEWQKVGNLVGVDEAALLKGVKNELKDPARINRIKRFWCALMLNELVQETNLGKVAHKYAVNKGVLQSLQHGAASYSGMITVFCEELHWANMALLFEQFQSRLAFGVMRDLVQLVRVPYLTAVQARSLHSAGFPNLTKLATADRTEIAHALRTAGAFEMVAEKDSGMRRVLLNGLPAMADAEAAELVMAEARRLVETDMEAEGFLVIPKNSLDRAVKSNS